ncbi:MAG: hypothetical protein ABWZ58_04480 [Acidimicrobiia bacterium]
MLERFLGVVAMAFVAGCVAAASATTSSTPNIATSTTTPSPTALASEPTRTVVVLPAVEHRIGVRLVDGAGQFYDRLSGARFVPRGVNLIRLSGGGTARSMSVNTTRDGSRRRSPTLPPWATTW